MAKRLEIITHNTPNAKWYLYLAKYLFKEKSDFTAEYFVVYAILTSFAKQNTC